MIWDELGAWLVLEFKVGSSTTVSSNRRARLPQALELQEQPKQRSRKERAPTITWAGSSAPGWKGPVATEGKVTIMARALREQWGELRPGDHIAFIYEDSAELTSFAARLIKDGLARGERCVYVVDDLEAPEVTEALVKSGVDVNLQIERGALVLVTAKEYNALPRFDALR